MVPLVVKILATLTLVGDIVIIITLLTLLTGAIRSKTIQALLKKKAPYMYLFVFIVSTISMVGSLFFSEIAKYNPCVLCWYQRIAMYPQVFLTYLAMARNEKVLTPYLLLLNVIGAVIASYHYIIQRIPSTSIFPCEYGFSCKTIQSLSYGYITIPMMALTAFVLNILLLSLLKKKNV